jgi:hypothetical protein
MAIRPARLPAPGHDHELDVRSYSVYVPRRGPRHCRLWIAHLSLRYWADQEKEETWALRACLQTPLSTGNGC